MTVLEYLRSPDAVEETRLLLSQPLRGPYPPHWIHNVGNGVVLLTLDRCGAWRRVRLSHEKEDGLGFVNLGSVYYRQTQDGHFLSDCGESLTGIMLRTGCTWAQAHQRIAMVVSDSTLFCGHASQGEIGYGIDGHKHSDDLPTAIIRVLRAVAACAEVGK